MLAGTGELERPKGEPLAPPGLRLGGPLAQRVGLEVEVFGVAPIPLEQQIEELDAANAPEAKLERLEEFDWEGYRAKYGNIQRLDRILGAEGDTRFEAFASSRSP